MDSDSNGNSAVELCGRTFRKVECGLDEKQIIPFVEELIEDRDKLLKRQVHLSSLTRLSERTVIEANDLARQIKQEAEENARRIMEEKKAEAAAMARSEVHAIMANAEKELETLLGKEIAELQSQLRDAARGLSAEILSQAESVKKHMVRFEEDVKKKLLALEAVAGQVSLEEDSRAGDISVSVTAEAVTPADPVAQSTTIEAEEIAPGSERTSEENTEWVELEILPPRDKDSIESIKTYLNGVDGVATVKLISMIDKTLIEVFMNKSIDLVGMLSTLPEVDQAQEVIDGTEKKINVVLSIKSELERNKELLNRTTHRIANRIHSVGR